MYARDNPEAITDPTDHGWWSSFTSAVSNAAGGVSSAITSDVSSAATDIVSAASNPETQAIALTTGIDVGTGIAIGLTGGTILATPVGQALVGAAISSTVYTVTSGSQATLVGAGEAAVTGAIGGALTGGIGGLLDGTGAAAEELAVSMTPNEIGDVGEGALANDVGGVSQQYMRTNLGGRFLDQYVPESSAGFEAKTGFQYLSQSNAMQIAKDNELLSTGQLNSMEWRFYRSPVTGQVGGSGPLLQALNDLGIVYRMMG